MAIWEACDKCKDVHVIFNSQARASVTHPKLYCTLSPQRSAAALHIQLAPDFKAVLRTVLYITVVVCVIS